MSKLPLHVLGLEIKKKRGEKGLKEAATEIGVSIATLSRIESGKQPDLETFTKICQWLSLDPSDVLGFNPTKEQTLVSDPLASYTQAQFRAGREWSPRTAEHLAKLILCMETRISELNSA